MPTGLIGSSGALSPEEQERQRQEAEKKKKNGGSGPALAAFNIGQGIWDRITGKNQGGEQIQQYTPREEYFKVDPGGVLGNMWQQGYAGSQGRDASYFKATPGTQIATGPQAELRKQQMAYIQQLQGQAAGTGGPSAAEMLIQNQRDKNISQAMALGASQRGISAGAAARGAQQQAGQAGLEATQQGAIMRAQEQQQAQQMLGGALSGAREQDIGLALQQAGLDQQAALANLQSEQGQKQMNDAMTQYYMSAGLSLEQARLQAQVAIEELRAQQQIAMNQALTAQQEGKANRWAGLLGGGLSAAGLVGAAALFSDRRVKKEIDEDDEKIDAFMKDLKSYSYKYKDEKYAPGKQFGVMAQDLEKSEVGKTIVIQTPKGKMINTTMAIGPILSSIARINERQSVIEKALKRRK